MVCTICSHNVLSSLQVVTAKNALICVTSRDRLRQSTGLRFVFWNLGGAGGKAEWLCSLIVALQVDVFGLQEDWDHAELRLELPPKFHVSYSVIEGMGTGFVIGCRRSLLARGTVPHIVCDEAEYFSVAFHHHAHGVILVQTLHVSPHSTYKARKEVLQT